jgi:hypothetical protein
VNFNNILVNEEARGSVVVGVYKHNISKTNSVSLERSEKHVMAEFGENIRYFDNPWLSVKSVEEDQVKFDSSIKLESVIDENLSQIELNRNQILSMRFVVSFFFDF